MVLYGTRQSLIPCCAAGEIATLVPVPDADKEKMEQNRAVHPDLDTLELYALHRLDSLQERTLERHIFLCRHCQQSVIRLAREAQLIRAALAPATPDGVSQRGHQSGRFEDQAPPIVPCRHFAFRIGAKGSTKQDR